MNIILVSWKVFSGNLLVALLRMSYSGCGCHAIGGEDTFTLNRPKRTWCYEWNEISSTFPENAIWISTGSQFHKGNFWHEVLLTNDRIYENVSQAQTLHLCLNLIKLGGLIISALICLKLSGSVNSALIWLQLSGSIFSALIWLKLSGSIFSALIWLNLSGLIGLDSFCFR